MDNTKVETGQLWVSFKEMSVFEVLEKVFTYEHSGFSKYDTLETWSNGYTRHTEIVVDPDGRNPGLSSLYRHAGNIRSMDTSAV